MLVSCAKCSAQLKLPDNAAGKKVRCPKCQAVFTAEAAQPAKAKAATKNAAANDDELDDEPTVDEQKQEERARKGRVTRTKVALLLMVIGHCLNTFAILLSVIFLIVVWTKNEPSSERGVIIGVPAIIGWVVNAAGIGIAISGLRKQNTIGLAIALTSVSVLHIVFLIMTATVTEFGSSSRTRMPGMPFPISSGAPSQLQTAETALPHLVIVFRIFSEKLGALASVMIGIMYQLNVFSISGLFGLLAGLCEIARWILLGFWMRSVARTSRAGDLETMPILLAVGQGGIVGLFFLVNLLVALLTTGVSSQGAAMAMIHLMFAVQLVFMVCVGGLFACTALAAHTLRSRVRELPKKPTE